MNLTKQYRVIHIGAKILNKEIEFESGVITYLPNGAIGFESDFKHEVENYIQENNLGYEYAKED